LFRARKLDMEMPPDTLETVGVNELFVTVGVDVSFTTEEASSGSLGTHRAISSNSNTERTFNQGWWVSSQQGCLDVGLSQRLP
jgi:hypothetical protein